LTRYWKWSQTLKDWRKIVKRCRIAISYRYNRLKDWAKTFWNPFGVLFAGLSLGAAFVIWLYEESFLDFLQATFTVLGPALAIVLFKVQRTIDILDAKTKDIEQVTRLMKQTRAEIEQLQRLEARLVKLAIGGQPPNYRISASPILESEDNILTAYKIVCSIVKSHHISDRVNQRINNVQFDLTSATSLIETVRKDASAPTKQQSALYPLDRRAEQLIELIIRLKERIDSVLEAAKKEQPPENNRRQKVT